MSEENKAMFDFVIVNLIEEIAKLILQRYDVDRNGEIFDSDEITWKNNEKISRYEVSLEVKKR